jgi:diadenylate cyclase
VSIIGQLRILDPTWRDVVEILLVAFVLYRALLLIHGTRAAQMLFGIVILVFVYAAAWFAKLTMITYLLGLVFTYGAFAALVIFQPELRQALAHLGQTPVARLLVRRLQENEVADEIAEAIERLSRSGTGALVAVEREHGLGDFIESGSAMQAKVSADLLQTIFTPYSPLHDGAVIVRGDTIVGAGCILPLTQRALPDRALGTRHRAAIGLSEESDAIVVIVSEESSQVSLAIDGRLLRGVTPDQVREVVAGRGRRPAAAERSPAGVGA